MLNVFVHRLGVDDGVVQEDEINIPFTIGKYESQRALKIRGCIYKPE